MFQSEERISAKFRAGALKAPGDQNQCDGVGWQLTEALQAARPAFGKEQCGTVAKLLRAMATQMCEEGQNPSLKAATSPGACTPLPFLHSRWAHQEQPCCVPAQPKDSFKGLHHLPSWHPPAGSPVVFLTLNSTLTHVFGFVFFNFYF